VQGQPGTGKTHTVACITLSYALLKIKVAVTAPSNTAIEANMCNLIKHLDMLDKVDPTARANFLIVFLTSSSVTKADLKNIGELAGQIIHPEQATADMIAEGEDSQKDEFAAYKPWTHIKRSFTERIKIKTGNVAEAIQWMDWYQALCQGKRLK
jgi:hypothetical protein